MISQNDGKTEIYIGDGDVLTGFTPGPNIARVWFAPLPEPSPVPLNELTKVDNSSPPDSTVATIYFVKRESLEQFIKGLQSCLEKMTPKATDNEQTDGCD